VVVKRWVAGAVAAGNVQLARENVKKYAARTFVPNASATLCSKKTFTDYKPQISNFLMIGRIENRLICDEVIQEIKR